MSTLIKLIKKSSGKTYEQIKSRIQGQMIYVIDVSVPVERGDTIQYLDDKQNQQTKIVSDPGYQPEVLSYEAHYQIKVRDAEEHELSQIHLNSSDTESVFKNVFLIIENLELSPKQMETLEHELEKLHTQAKEDNFNLGFKNFIINQKDAISEIAPVIPVLSGLIN
jgi:hypothetical protein